MGRSADAWYDALGVEEIASIPVGEWAADDSVLFLWTTDPFLENALHVIERWGFVYKTVAFVWVKARRGWKGGVLDPSKDFHVGMGYWTRANPELCLLATKGHPKRISRSVRRLIVEPVREHSRKPDGVRGRILELVGGPALEMFARERAPGWDAWGIEVDAFEEGRVPERRFRSDFRK